MFTGRLGPPLVQHPNADRSVPGLRARPDPAIQDRRPAIPDAIRHPRVPDPGPHRTPKPRPDGTGSDQAPCPLSEPHRTPESHPDPGQPEGRSPDTCLESDPSEDDVMQLVRAFFTETGNYSSVKSGPILLGW